MEVTASPPPDTSDAPLGRNLLVARRPLVEDAHFDMTAMVDVVFMMNIFFLVSWVGAALSEVDLPAARHCAAADADASVVLTLTGGAGQNCSVYLGDASPGAALGGTEIEQRVAEAVEAGVREGKNAVLIKAEKNVLLRDVARVAAAAVGSKKLKLNLAVLEKER